MAFPNPRPGPRPLPEATNVQIKTLQSNLETVMDAMTAADSTIVQIIGVGGIDAAKIMLAPVPVAGEILAVLQCLTLIWTMRTAVKDWPKTKESLDDAWDKAKTGLGRANDAVAKLLGEQISALERQIENAMRTH